MSYIPYRLTLRAPAVAADLGGDPNSARSLRHIPGAVLQGAVAAALARAQDGGSELDDLVLSGRVRYLNAYPEIDEHRSLPVPRSWRVDRADRSAIFDLLGDDGEVVPASLGGRPAEFATVQFNGPVSAAPLMRSTTHHQRDRRKGHAGRTGTVFTYEALEVGQMFAGLVQVTSGKPDLVKERLERLLPWVRVGKSRNAGYGGDATLELGQVQAREVAVGHCLQVRAQAGQSFVVLLAAPAIVRNPNTGSVDPSRLGEAVVALLDGKVSILDQVVEVETIGGYNSRWGLPLPQRHAAAAGSVLLVQAAQALSTEEIDAAQDVGIGERRVAGLGRLVFLRCSEGPPTCDPPRLCPTTRPDGSPPPLALDIQDRVIDARARREVLARADEVVKAFKLGTVPPASLLGRMRRPFAAGHGQGQRMAWDPEKLKAPARDNLRRCHDDKGATLLDWIGQAVTDFPLDRRVVESVTAGAVVDARRAKNKLEEHDADRLRRLLIDAVLAGLQARRRKARQARSSAEVATSATSTTQEPEPLG